ncbi:type 1 glutamine amidotransferase [Phaeobacter sp.]|uniref:type 1 glutamine amidotransferase n=1 Tax=Phaeobacter sp. TaxID=1902409 RepID=UPI0025F2A338|nr:type 1 glutamine amidotransferase [Phaeobacter sp.]
MHLAILLTNTDHSDFAAAHPHDSEKFNTLIQSVRPGWRCSLVDIQAGHVPNDLASFDGAMITGSPSSINDPLPWIPAFLSLIRDLDERKFPLFGACFGHQAIAVALGGSVGTVPGGWVQGLTRNEQTSRTRWTAHLPDHVKLFGSHKEYVDRLPKGATELSRCNGLTSGFAIGSHIYTTQHHPEMSPAFIAALTEYMAPTLGAEIHADAMKSLQTGADSLAFAESIAQFFEQA